MTASRPIFCANSGRVGSRYLAGLLGSAKETIAFHEAEPKMTGRYLELINDRDYASSYADRRIKCRAIEDLVAEGKGRIYCETSNMFIKTFYDVVLDHFVDARIIILRRDMLATLKSFIELGYFSRANAAWPNWMSSPNAKTAALPAIAPDNTLDQVDLCIAYLLDVEARTQRMRRERKDVLMIEVTLEELGNWQHIERLFARLELTPTPATAELFGQKVNAKDKIKSRLGHQIDLKTCEDRVIGYVLRARQQMTAAHQTILTSVLSALRLDPLAEQSRSLQA